MKISLKYKLPKGFKEKWLKALRSGKFKQQTNGHLIDGYGYCCLGVAGKVCGIKIENMSYRSFLVGSVTGVEKRIPKTALKALNQKYGDQDTDYDSIQGYLAYMNDGHRGFKYIANWIEKHL